MLTLRGLLRQVGEAAIEMASACAEQSQARLRESLEEDGTPKIIEVQVGEQAARVPLLTLIPPSVMLPETVEVEMESDVSLSDTEDGESEMNLTMRALRDQTAASYMKVRVTLKRQEPQEALEQVRDRLTHQMSDQLHESSQSEEESHG